MMRRNNVAQSRQHQTQGPLGRKKAPSRTVIDHTKLQLQTLMIMMERMSDHKKTFPFYVAEQTRLILMLDRSRLERMYELVYKQKTYV